MCRIRTAHRQAQRTANAGHCDRPALSCYRVPRAHAELLPTASVSSELNRRRGSVSRSGIHTMFSPTQTAQGSASVICRGRTAGIGAEWGLRRVGEQPEDARDAFHWPGVASGAPPGPLGVPSPTFTSIYSFPTMIKKQAYIYPHQASRGVQHIYPQR